MIKTIVTDKFLLSQKSIPATKEDIPVIQDLLDTINEHKNGCVGMAANMIGINKSIIVVNDNDKYLVMVNPVILKTMGRIYEAEEGCLSHVGVKRTKRYETVKVLYYDESFKKRIKTFSNYTAQIIQHEIDHCNGILI